MVEWVLPGMSGRSRSCAATSRKTFRSCSFSLDDHLSNHIEHGVGVIGVGDSPTSALFADRGNGLGAARLAVPDEESASSSPNRCRGVKESSWYGQSARERSRSCCAVRAPFSDHARRYTAP